MTLFTVTARKQHHTTSEAVIELDVSDHNAATMMAYQIDRDGELPWRETESLQTMSTIYEAIPTPPVVRTFDIVVDLPGEDASKPVVSVMLAFPAGWSRATVDHEGRALRDAILDHLAVTASMGTYRVTETGK